MTRNGFGDAYSRGFERTVRFLMSRGASADYAEEVSQAAWVRGWERLHDLRDESAALGWVNMIALNIYRRAQWRERFIQPLEEMQSGITVDIVAIDAGRVLSFCMPRERALLEHQLEGVSIEDVARAAAVTSTAMRIRLLRVRRAVRARIEQRAARLRGAVTIGSRIAS